MQRVRFCFERLQTVKMSLNFKTWEGTEGVSEVKCVKFEETGGGHSGAVTLCCLS